MTIQEIDQALAAINAQVDGLKEEARALVRNRDRVLAGAKVAAMPAAEKEALLALLKGE